MLGPLLFLNYINDITTDLQSISFLYADDTSLLEVVDDPDVTAAKLNDDLELINTWTHKWLVTINSDKTNSMVFSTKRQKPLHPQLKYDNQIIESVSNHKHLGVTLSSNLLWRTHVFNIYKKRLNLLKGLKFKINRAALDNLYKALIRPILEYADVLWE